MMILTRPYAEQMRHARAKAHFLHRRADLCGAPQNIKAQHWLAILTTFGERCAYCNRSAQTVGQPLTADHFIPLSSSLTLGSVVWNVVPACQECNWQKNGDDPFGWLDQRFGREQGRAITRRVLTYLAEARFWYEEERREVRQAARQRKAARKAAIINSVQI